MTVRQKFEIGDWLVTFATNESDIVSTMRILFLYLPPLCVSTDVYMYACIHEYVYTLIHHVDTHTHTHTHTFRCISPSVFCFSCIYNRAYMHKHSTRCSALLHPALSQLSPPPLPFTTCLSYAAARIPVDLPT